MQNANKKIKQGTGSNLLFRFVGYGLLMLALLDLVEMLVPMRLLDPVWQIQTTGALVEFVPVLLLGLLNSIKKVVKCFLGVLLAGFLLIGLALRHSKIFSMQH